MKWWSEWIFALIPASVFLIICKGGFFYSLILWIIFLANGWKTVKQIPSDENVGEWVKYLIIGIIVLVITAGIQIAALFD